jgi:hypothetical protein
VTVASAGLACHSRPHNPSCEVQPANADGCQLPTQRLPRGSDGNQMARQVFALALSLILVTMSRQSNKAVWHQRLADSVKAPCLCATVGYEAIGAPKDRRVLEYGDS